MSEDLKFTIIASVSVPAVLFCFYIQSVIFKCEIANVIIADAAWLLAILLIVAGYSAIK